MVHSIWLWRHLYLGWFTPSCFYAITWDGLLHPALTPLKPGMVHSIRLWRHLYLRWFSLSCFDATYMGWFTPSGFDAISLGWFTPSCFDVTYLWWFPPSCFDASYLGWFAAFGSGTSYTWDRPHPALTSLTWCNWPHPATTLASTDFRQLTPRYVATRRHPNIIRGWDTILGSKIHSTFLYNNSLPLLSIESPVLSMVFSYN